MKKNKIGVFGTVNKILNKKNMSKAYQIDNKYKPRNAKDIKYLKKYMNKMKYIEDMVTLRKWLTEHVIMNEDPISHYRAMKKIYRCDHLINRTRLRITDKQTKCWTNYKQYMYFRDNCKSCYLCDTRCVPYSKKHRSHCKTKKHKTRVNNLVQSIHPTLNKDSVSIIVSFLGNYF